MDRRQERFSRDVMYEMDGLESEVEGMGHCWEELIRIIDGWIRV